MSYEYLQRVGAQLDAPYLRPDEQANALGALEYALANEPDPTVRPYVLHLVRRLLGRPDTAPQIAERGRALLWFHEHQTQHQTQHQSPHQTQPPQPSPFAQPAPPPAPPAAPARRTRAGVVVASVVGALLVLGLLVGGVAMAQSSGRPPVAPAPPPTSSAPPVTTTTSTTTAAPTTTTQSNRTGVTIAGPTTASTGTQSEYTVDGPSTNTNCVWVLSGNGQPNQNHSGCAGVTVTWQVRGTYYLAVAWTDTVTGQTDSTVITIQVR